MSKNDRSSLKDIICSASSPQGEAASIAHYEILLHCVLEYLVVGECELDLDDGWQDGSIATVRGHQSEY